MEFLEAVAIGMFRGVWNRYRAKGDTYSFNKRNDVYSGWGISIEGACAEKVVAKFVKKYWVGVLSGKDDGADVGEYGVRSSWRNDGDLILHPKDRDDRIFIHVAGVAPWQVITGWLLAGDGKKEEYWRTPETNKYCTHEAYFVPQSNLNRMTTLPGLGQGEGVK
jgi:hypothetical protein